MRIAIVGSGISGLATAYLLSDAHDITVFEADDYVGGHTNTEDVAWQGRSYAVNTGFIVFNAATYPNFITLMRRLGVEWQPSVMSFSVQCEKHPEFAFHPTHQPAAAVFLPDAAGCLPLQAGLRRVAPGR
jgi:predicted NAD/FAD-binding protein